VTTAVELKTPGDLAMVARVPLVLRPPGDNVLDEQPRGGAELFPSDKQHNFQLAAFILN
jgi:hypothetical protein